MDDIPKELQDKLAKWESNKPANKQVQILEDIATMAQHMVGIMQDDHNDPGRKTLIIDHVTGEDFVKILKNMQEGVSLLKDQKPVEIPDYAKPVVEAVSKLEKPLQDALKAIQSRKDPVVNVAAPNVQVDSSVDLTKLERIISKDIPKAFREAISLVPKTEIPEENYTPLIEKLAEIGAKLDDIDTGVRMKSQPGVMKVVNPDGTELSSTLIPDVVKEGSIVINGGRVIMPVVSGMSGWVMSYFGTYATGASLTMEASFDQGDTYSSVRMLQGSSGVLGYVITIAAVSNSTSYFIADIPNGATHLQVRCSAWAAPTGSINIKMTQSVDRFASPVATQSVTGKMLRQ